MGRISAVIFDMDGVLVEAKEWHYEALNKALKPFNEHIYLEEHLSTFDGLPTIDKLKLLSKRGLDPNDHAAIIAAKQKATLEVIKEKCKPNPMHEFALSHLKADGLKLGVASNSIRASIEVMMEMTNLHQYLDVILSNEDTVNAKPDPEIYNLAMERLKVLPDETLIIEDNPHGVKAAIRSGANVMVVRNSFEVYYSRIRRYIEILDDA